jgi:uncharacterized membrane protein YdbT with pleckstrin-like domain
MGYIENNLTPNEQVVYKAKVHWFIFVPGIILCLCALAFVREKQIEAGMEIEEVIRGGLFLLGLLSLLKAFIAKISTELAVTSKRVIAKSGLIGRKTVELSHNKVESFNVDQSILGRIFGYGVVTVNGTGGGKTPFSNIAYPLEFRREAMEAIEQSQKQA